MEIKQIQLKTQQKFEEIKHTNEDGVEYWEARELAKLLGYSDWRNFVKVMEKARQACVLSDQSINYHFVEVNKMIKVAVHTPKGTKREININLIARKHKSNQLVINRHKLINK